MNIEEVLKNKIILKLQQQISGLTYKIAETESKAELFKELLEIREQELLAFQKDDEKMQNLGSENVLK